jgi:hypothetical protein
VESDNLIMPRNILLVAGYLSSFIHEIARETVLINCTTFACVLCELILPKLPNFENFNTRNI